MFKTVVALLVGLMAINVMAQTTDLTTCRNPSGKAFRHFTGPQDKSGAGWSDEQIRNGVLTLVQGQDGKFDMLFIDVRKKPISMTQDGGRVIFLRSGPEELSLLVHYDGSATEIYSFFKEKDGKHRYTVLASRTGPQAFAPKSAIMVGDCDPIRFDLIK
jgi:hypothetical protein